MFSRRRGPTQAASLANNKLAPTPSSCNLEDALMDKHLSSEMYRVWAHDNQVYGPIDHSTLTQWVHENRVLHDTWVYLETLNEWRPARRIESIQHQFPAHDTSIMLHPDHTGSDIIAPEELRQFTVLSSLSN